MTCTICSAEFVSKRADKKTCSPSCRVKLSRQDTPQESRASAIAALTKSIEKKFEDPRQQAIYEAFLQQMPKTEWLSTNTPLDELTQLPKNKITILYGKQGIGKSTISHLIAANSGLKTLYIDTEASLSPERLSQLWIDPSKFAVKQEAFIEDIYDILTNPQTLKNFDLIIWDSVGNASFRTEAEGESGDANIGVKARIMNKLMRVMPIKLVESGTTLLLINQERDGIGMYQPNYIPGGKGQLYSATVVIRLTGTFPKIKAEITKSRVGENKKLEFTLVTK